jgi:methyl-accepting chemotaxis protein
MQKQNQPNKNMKSWTIGKRITTGNAILIALLLIVGGVASTSLSRLENFAGAHLRDDAIPGIVYCSQMAEYAMRAQIRTLMAGSTTDSSKRSLYLSQMEQIATQVSTAFTNYEGAITQAEDRRNFEDLLKKRDDYRATREDYLALVKAGKTAEAEAFLVEKLDPSFATYRDQMDLMLKWNQNVAEKVTNDMVQTARNATRWAAAICGISVLIAIAIGWIIIRGTNRVLASVANTLSDGSNQVVSAAGQVSASSQTLAEGSSQQASSLEETSSSLEEMSSMIKRNSENALKANELAKHARTAADKGVDDMQTMAAAMEAIKVSSDDIAKIIKTIDEIAFQTNILALNAAVEAARAGEAGMGFAVVADEVRNLAQRCAQAAKETASKIEGAIAKTGQGVEITGKVAAALNEIVGKARQVDELVTEVAGASREQTVGITQINTAVGQMDKVTQSNAATAEESAAAAEELNAQAETMKRSVAELLQLVGGQGQDRATRSVARPSRPKNRTVTVSVPKPDLMLNGNGHAHAEPVLATKGGGRSEIPLEGDFKDF